MKFEDWLLKEEAKRQAETKKVSEVVVESATEASKAKEHKDHLPYVGTDHDRQVFMDMYKKNNPALYASILNWD